MCDVIKTQSGNASLKKTSFLLQQITGVIKHHTFKKQTLFDIYHSVKNKNDFFHNVGCF